MNITELIKANGSLCTSTKSLSCLGHEMKVKSKINPGERMNRACRMRFDKNRYEALEKPQV